DFHVTGVQTCALPIYTGYGRGGHTGGASLRHAHHDFLRHTRHGTRFVCPLQHRRRCPRTGAGRSACAKAVRRGWLGPDATEGIAVSTTASATALHLAVLSAPRLAHCQSTALIDKGVAK